MRNCDKCNQWAQWKVQDPETKAILFFCGTHEQEFIKLHPVDEKGNSTKVWFCGAVPLTHVGS